jgi:riboflavin kinase
MMMQMIAVDEIHMTDILFSQLCEKRFGINRGIYNTIDSMFYEKGIKDILKRRNAILSFLIYAVGTTEGLPSAPYKFGNGGLSIKMNEYCLISKISD